MKQFVTLMSLILNVGFMPQNQIKVELGFVLSEKLISEYSSQKKKGKFHFDLIATTPSQLRPFFMYNTQDVDYLIAYDKETRQIKYIHTEDKDFRTADNLKVGDCLSYSTEQIVMHPGWNIR